MRNLLLNDSRLVTAFLVTGYKLATLIIGFLIVRMGFALLQQGITGQFKFKADFKGFKADIASAAPGVFFVFAGGVLIGLTIFNGLRFDFSDIQDSQQPPRSSIHLPETPPP